MDGHIETDLANDTLSSLQMVEWALNETKSNDLMWKWVILGVHSALQSAMIAYLSGTAQFGAWKKGTAIAWMKNWDDGGDGTTPQPYLASAETLFSRIQNPDDRIETTPGGVIVVTESAQKSFRRLNYLRNELTHFASHSHFIEIHGLPAIIIDCVMLVDAIAADGWAFRHAPDVCTEIRRLTSVISEN